MMNANKICTLFTFSLIVGCKSFAAQPMPKAEILTQEQIRTASCALSAMPERSRDLLIAAVVQYMKDKDSIAVIRKFQIDDVPTAIVKCFEVHAQHMLATERTSRQFINFYDGAERALRLQITIVIARQRNNNPEQIRLLNEAMYEGLLRYNRENP
jgi:hypothetical protein